MLIAVSQFFLTGHRCPSCPEAGGTDPPPEWRVSIYETGLCPKGNPIVTEKAKQQFCRLFCLTVGGRWGSLHIFVA